ncbi:MAG TPA: chemotaxis protein CheW [Herpetosiphonaceae bacterium]|nr:chemotaxis protein CheW [Herpetosiphonaceae bacterium]
MMYYPVWVGRQRFLVAMARVRGIERIPDVGSSTTFLHTGWGRIRLYELHIWAGESLRDQPSRLALVLNAGQQPAGVVVDRIEDTVEITAAVASLPDIVADTLLDPTISGVLLLDSTPCLVLDLEAFIVMHGLSAPPAAASV